MTPAASAGELSPALYRAGSGEPVVLLHGATGNWRHWRPVLADLVARFEVIAPTLSGHDGAGPYPDELPMDMGGAADSMERHLDELEVGSAHLVGNSLGGALAIELAKRGRARSVVAISPACGWGEGGREAKRLAAFFKRTSWLARATLPHAELVMRAGWRRRIAFRDIMRRGQVVGPADAVALVRATARCSILERLVAALRGGDELLLRDLDRISVPVLLAWAQRDRVLPERTCAIGFRDQIPGAEFRALPGVGHVPMWDDSGLVVETISGWVERHA